MLAVWIRVALREGFVRSLHRSRRKNNKKKRWWSDWAACISALVSAGGRMLSSDVNSACTCITWMFALG